MLPECSGMLTFPSAPDELAHPVRQKVYYVIAVVGQTIADRLTPKYPVCSMVFSRGHGGSEGLGQTRGGFFLLAQLGFEVVEEGRELGQPIQDASLLLRRRHRDRAVA